MDLNGPAISVSDLEKTFHPAPPWLKVLVKSPIREDVHALRGVSFHVSPGEVCALVGPNGAGKTTLFRILVGLTTPTGGGARVFGHDAVSESLAIRRLIGWMPTSSQSLFARHTCAQNLKFNGRIRGLSEDKLDRAIDEVLEVVGLEAVRDSSVVSLSAGMVARLQLARALLHRPKLLILDEPTASVDPVAAYGLINTIMDIVKGKGLAAIVSSHRLDEIEALHSHVLLLHQGKILFDGELDTLRGQLDRPRLALTFSDESVASSAEQKLASESYILGRHRDGAELTVDLQPGVPSGRVLRAIEDSLDNLEESSNIRVPLREVLAEVYGAKENNS